MRFMNSVQTDGSLFYNSTLVPQDKVSRKDIQAIAVPANDLAQQLGSVQVASLVILSAFVALTGIVPKDALFNAIEGMLPPKAREKFLDMNLAALKEGVRFSDQLKTSLQAISEGF